jgi:hypothetical protein
MSVTWPTLQAEETAYPALSCSNLSPRRNEPLLYMTVQYSHQSSHLQLSIRYQTLNRQDNPVD